MTAVQEVRGTTAVPAFARWRVLGVGAVVAALLTAVSGRYGWFGDELYFVSAGRRLDWGYADQPPLLPLIARLADLVAPGVVEVARVPATLATVAGIVFAALAARELGASGAGQAVAAAAYGSSPFLIGTGHLLATSTVDPVLWTALTWLVLRWVRTRDDRLLVAAGVVTALALQTKFLVVAFWAVALPAAALLGPRDLLRRPMLWVGAGIAVAATVPTLLWQAANGWPQLAMGAVIAAESVYTGGRLWFVPSGLLIVGALCGTVLAGYGLARLLRDERLRPYRFLAVTAVGVVVLFALAGGRPYYVAGAFPVLWAAGAAGLGGASRWWRWIVSLPAFAVSLVVVVAGNTVPVAPVESLSGQPMAVGFLQNDEVGWPQYVDDVAAAYRALPPEVRARTGVVGGSYWAGAALDVLGPDRGLPAAHSPHRGFGWFGHPGEDVDAVLVLGDPGALVDGFATARQVGVVDNDLDVANLHQGAPIWLLEGRTVPWPELWERARTL